MASKAETRALYNANDGLSGRDGGPYLDQEEDRLAEIRRAKVEDREPDLENPPASAGTVLVTAGQLLANQGVANLPSRDGVNPMSEEDAVKSLADSDSNALKARSEIPQDAFTPLDEPVDLSIRSALMTDGEAEEGESNTEPVEKTEERRQATQKRTASKQAAAKKSAKKATPSRKISSTEKKDGSTTSTGASQSPTS